MPPERPQDWSRQIATAKATTAIAPTAVSTTRARELSIETVSPANSAPICHTVSATSARSLERDDDRGSARGGVCWHPEQSF